MSTTPSGQPSQSTQANAKPSLAGVRLKARKGVQRSQAKYEPDVFRDQLYKQLESVPPSDFDAITLKLDQAGNTLDYRRYADPLFEIFLVGGLLAPGGQFVDDDAPPSPFSIANVKEPVDVAEVKKYIDVLNKLIRRYKYLQKPLEESTLKGVLQYINRFSKELDEKLAIATALMMSTGLVSASVLSTLQKEHLVKDDLALHFIDQVFRTYLNEASIDHLAASLKRGGIYDLLLFWPTTKRDDSSVVVRHFKEVGLPQVAEHWQRRQVNAIKEQTLEGLKEMVRNEEEPKDIIANLRGQLAVHPIAEHDFVSLVWQGLMDGVDWSSRSDQIEAFCLKEVNKNSPILEAFTKGARTEVALICAIQVYCYEDTRIIKTFPQILKVLYNRDVISDQAILYWAQKGSKPQGRQHFLKATELLVKFLQEQDDSDEEEEE